MARQFGLKIRRLNCTKTHVDLLLHYTRNRLYILTRTPTARSSLASALYLVLAVFAKVESAHARPHPLTVG